MSTQKLEAAVEIGDQTWPVRFDFGAMRRSLPLFGLSRVTDIDVMLVRMSSTGDAAETGDQAKGVPAEAVAPLMRNMVRSGLRHSDDERELPPVEYFEDAMDDDIGTFTRVILALSEAAAPSAAEAENPPKPAPKKAGKKPTGKR